jgi:hypothetical protein
MIHHPRWIEKKYFTCSQIVLIARGMKFEKKKWNLIQIINDYGIENKHDLTK